MLLLTKFFQDLASIQFFRDRMTSHKQVDEQYQEYLQLRLDFQTKYARILRGMDLLTDQQYKLLYDYFNGKIQSGCNELIDQRLSKLIYEVENAI